MPKSPSVSFKDDIEEDIYIYNILPPSIHILLQ